MSGTFGDVPGGLVEGVLGMVVEAQLFRLRIGIDTNANHKPFRRRSLHGIDKCGFYDIQNRGHSDLMERGVKCYRWCW